MNKDTVRKSCPFYKDDESCKKLQPKRNCYQCVLSNAPIIEADLRRLRKHCDVIEEENRQLKFLLGEKFLKEYQANQTPV